MTTAELIRSKSPSIAEKIRSKSPASAESIERSLSRGGVHSIPHNENRRLPATEAFATEANYLKSIGLEILDWYPIKGENRAFVIIRTVYGNKAVVVVNLKEGKLAYNSRGTCLYEYDVNPRDEDKAEFKKNFLVLDKVLDEGSMEDRSAVGVYFEFDGRVIVAFNENDAIKKCFYIVHSMDARSPTRSSAAEAHPYPIIKYELLTQPIEDVISVKWDIDNSANIMLYKHMMKIINKNKNLAAELVEKLNDVENGAEAFSQRLEEIRTVLDSAIEGFRGAIRKFDMMLEKLKFFAKYYADIGGVQEAALLNKYQNEWVPMNDAIGETQGTEAYAENLKTKIRLQEELYAMMGKARQINRIKVIWRHLHEKIKHFQEVVLVDRIQKFQQRLKNEIKVFMNNIMKEMAGLNWATVGSSMVDELLGFGEASGYDISAMIESARVQLDDESFLDYDSEDDKPTYVPVDVLGAENV
jgi:hypothetical protein